MARNVNVPPLDEAPVTVVGSTPQSEFAFDFPFWESDDLIVYIDGVLLGSGGYTVQGHYVQNGDPVEGGYGSGTVTLNTAVSNCSVTLDRLVVASRESQFSRAAPLGMPALNSDLNKLAARQQDLARILSRAVVAAVGNDAPSPQDVIDAASAIGQKLDKATAADDGLFRLAPAVRTQTIGEYLRQQIFLLAFKTASNTWADAFDAAIAYADTQGGGDIFLPPLNMTLDRTVVIPFGRINLIGRSRGATVFYVSFGDGDVFRFRKADGASYLASTIQRCSISYAGGSTPTAGAAIKFDGVGECEAHDVTVIGLYRAVEFVGNANRNCRCYGVGQSGIIDVGFLVAGGGNQYIKLATAYDNTSSTSSVSIRITKTERCDLDFATSSLHGVGVEIKPDAGALVQNVFATFNDLDASKGTALVIDPAAANSVVRNIFFTGGSLSASVDRGLWIKTGAGQVGDVHLNGVMIQSNLKEGVYANKGRLYLTDCVIARNGSNAGQSGVRLGSGVEVLQMNGGRIGPILGGPDIAERPMTHQNYQLFGLEVDAGFVGSAVLNGVDLTGNLTAPIQNNSATPVETNNCRGYRTTASGVATIPIGASFVTITPNVGPAITDATPILVSCLSNPDVSGVETIWRGGLTATSFDIVTSPFLNVSGADLKVAWEIRA